MFGLTGFQWKCKHFGPKVSKTQTKQNKHTKTNKKTQKTKKKTNVVVDVCGCVVVGVVEHAPFCGRSAAEDGVL